MYEAWLSKDECVSTLIPSNYSYKENLFLAEDEEKLLFTFSDKISYQLSKDVFQTVMCQFRMLKKKVKKVLVFNKSRHYFLNICWVR